MGTREAARIAGRHQRTIVAWIHAGKLKALKIPGNRGPYLIYKDDLISTVRKLTTPQPYEPKENE